MAYKPSRKFVTEDGIAIDYELRKIATELTSSGSGTITGVVAGTALTGGGTTGSVTLNVADVAVAQLADAAVQTSSESFADNDTSLMTSAAIQDKILSYGYITGVTNISGNAGTATALQTARTIGGVSFDGTANINLAGVNTAGNQNTSGNAATATLAATTTALATARAINGVDFDGTAPITVTAAAGTLTGTELKSTVVTSSLTSVGTLGSLTVSGAITLATVTASTVTVAADDLVLITDTSDSANVKKVTAQSIADLGGGGAVTFADGSAAAPSIKFTDDTDTGIYRTTETNSGGSTVAVVGITTDGTVRATFGDDIADFKSAKITTTDIIDANELRADDGSAADPSFTFSSDGNTGWYRYAADSLACSVGGNEVWYVSNAGNNVWKTHTNTTMYNYMLGASHAILYMGGHSSTSMGGIYVTSSGYLYTRAGNAWRTRQSSSEFRPYYDSQMKLGSSSARWTQLYADTSTISTSDVNLKTDIVDTPLGLDFIKSLRPIQYKWKKTDGGKDGVRDHQGLIAQEVKAILDARSETNASEQAMWCDFSVDGVEDEIVDQDDPEKTITMPAPTDQALRYSELIGPIIKAVQELSIQMEENKCQCQN
jgi:hypothetical protein